MWADGTYEDAAGNEHTLMLRHTTQWQVAPVPNPGSGSNIFGGIARTPAGYWRSEHSTPETNG